VLIYVCDSVACFLLSPTPLPILSLKCLKESEADVHISEGSGGLTRLARFILVVVERVVLVGQAKVARLPILLMAELLAVMRSRIGLVKAGSGAEKTLPRASQREKRRGSGRRKHRTPKRKLCSYSQHSEERVEHKEERNREREREKESGKAYGVTGEGSAREGKERNLKSGVMKFCTFAAFHTFCDSFRLLPLLYMRLVSFNPLV
jgi:hypothetical protein